jgi:hypothetical protein
MVARAVKSVLSDILHHSQQDLKNRVYQRKVKVFRLQQSQETRFLALVQDMSPKLYGDSYKSRGDTPSRQRSAD